MTEIRGKMRPEVQKLMTRYLRDEIMPVEKEDPEASRAYGRAKRHAVKRSALGQWEVKENREEPIRILKEQEKDRVRELLPIRHERMSDSAFAFYRGSAALMAYDLSRMPVTGIMVQACGDAHIGNFGVFASGEHRLVFDINDFDETYTGPWEWDIMRLCTSVEICGRYRHFDHETRHAAVVKAARAYCEAMQRFAGMGTMDVWYSHLDIEQLRQEHAHQIPRKTSKMLDAVVQSAVGRNSLRAVHKWTETADGRLQIRSIPPILVPIRDMDHSVNDSEMFMQFLKRAMVQYRLSLPPELRVLLDQYTPVDLARKVVGVGSVGMRSYIVVLEGNSPEDPLVLQVKEAGNSVLMPYVRKTEKKEDAPVAYRSLRDVKAFLDAVNADNGRRVVRGQKAIQTAGDIMLGWMTIPDADGHIRDFYVRQLYNNKGTIDLGLISPEDLVWLAGICGWTLAHAHARTGNRYAIAGYVGKGGKFAEAMNSFALKYADQNDADYAVYVREYGKDRQKK